MEHVFEILDQAKDLREKIRQTFKKGAEMNHPLIASWIDKSFELDEVIANKLDELFERLVRLEDEVRGKGPQTIETKKPKK